MANKNSLMAKLKAPETSKAKTSNDTSPNVINNILSQESVQNVIKYKKTEFISIENISAYENNRLSIDNIEELKQQIQQVGLLEPLVVIKQSEDDYLLISGHRRLTAIKELSSEGNWNPNNVVECKIIKLDELSISGTDEMKIELLNLTANEHRNMTEADEYNMTLRWTEIIQKFRENGINVITIKNKNGEVIEKNIKGERTSAIVSDAMGLGTTKVKEITKINAYGSDKLIETLEADKISIHTAAMAANLPKEEQDAFLEEVLTKSDKIDSKSVEEHQSKINRTKKAPTQDIPTGYINTDIFKDDIKEISKQLKKSAITFSEEDYSKYQEALTTLKGLFRV